MTDLHWILFKWFILVTIAMTCIGIGYYIGAKDQKAKDIVTINKLRKGLCDIMKKIEET